jgi:hypothetical protein
MNEDGDFPLKHTDVRHEKRRFIVRASEQGLMILSAMQAAKHSTHSAVYIYNVPPPQEDCIHILTTLNIHNDG